MGTRRQRERQQDLWIAASDVVETPANAFYDRLNQILDEHKFDAKVELLCRKFYKKSGFSFSAYKSRNIPRRSIATSVPFSHREYREDAPKRGSDCTQGKSILDEERPRRQTFLRQFEPFMEVIAVWQRQRAGRAKPGSLT